MTRAYQEWLNSLRESDSSDIRNELTSKLVQLVRFRWELRTNKKEPTIDWQLEAIVNALNNFSFRFSPMYRSWIPKPNKPGQLRPNYSTQREGHTGDGQHCIPTEPSLQRRHLFGHIAWVQTRTRPNHVLSGTSQLGPNGQTY